LIKNALTRLIPAVLSLAWEVGKAIVVGILKGIANLLTALGNAMHNATHAAIMAVAGWAGSAAAAIGHAIVDGILGGITGLPGALKDKIGSAVTGALHGAMSLIGAHSPSTVFADKVGKPIAEGIILGYLLGIVDLPDKISDTLKAALEKGKAVVDAAVDKYKTAFSNLADEALTAFDRMTEAHATKSEKLLDKLVSRHDMEEFKKRVQEAGQAVKDAQSALNSFDPTQFDTPEAAAAAQKALQDDLASAQDTWNQLMYEKKKTALEAQAQKERENYEERRRIQRKHFEVELANMQEALMKHPLEYQKNQKKIIALLRSYGVSYHEVGTVLTREFAQGIMDALPEVEDAARAMANRVRGILRLGSPAKEGPMSDLDTWWRPFGKTLVSGLDMRPIEQAALSMAGLPYGAVGPGSGLAQSVPSAMGGQTIIVQQTVNGSVIHENDLNDRIREAIITEGRRGRTVTPV
jgi:hypothetical protein